ncbi:hypothetical protein FKM82_025357 [Ascaphus truei]
MDVPYLSVGEPPSSYFKADPVAAYLPEAPVAVSSGAQLGDELPVTQEVTSSMASGVSCSGGLARLALTDDVTKMAPVEPVTPPLGPESIPE